MGMFHTKDPSKNADHLFLPEINGCVKFCARGFECRKCHNKCKHWFQAHKITMDQIQTIGDKFPADGSGWFNKGSFVMINLKNKCKKLLGDANGSEHA